MTLTGKRRVGLFTSIGDNASFINTRFTGVNIHSDAYAGVIASQSTLNAVFNFIEVEGIIESSGGFVGGLIGTSYGSKFSNCFFEGIVSSRNKAGGLTGSARRGTTFFRCNVNGKIIIETYYGGGISGMMSEQSSMNETHASVEINGKGKLGGLVGFSNRLSAQNSYSEGKIQGSQEESGGSFGYICRLPFFRTPLNSINNYYLGQV